MVGQIPDENDYPISITPVHDDEEDAESDNSITFVGGKDIFSTKVLAN